jgi:hypothetical protein
MFGTIFFRIDRRTVGRFKPRLQGQNPPARVKKWKKSAQADLVSVAANSIRRGFTDKHPESGHYDETPFSRSYLILILGDE